MVEGWLRAGIGPRPISRRIGGLSRVRFKRHLERCMQANAQEERSHVKEEDASA